MATSNTSHSSKQTFILVAGAGHGAWCWGKVKLLLEAKGYLVIALDMPGSGIDLNVIENNTLDNDVSTLIDAANGVNGKVTLVGHSSGGIIISQAAELLGTEKIDRLIFLDAFLPKDGDSVFSMAENVGRVSPPSPDSAGSTERFIFSEDGKRFKWNPDLVQRYFYHDCSDDDIAFAKTRLTWQSVATLATPVKLTDSTFGNMKKYCILCTEAKDLDKNSLTGSVESDHVYRLPSSHSPFFSMPQQLVDILVSF